MFTFYNYGDSKKWCLKKKKKSGLVLSFCIAPNRSCAGTQMSFRESGLILWSEHKKHINVN